MRKITAIVSAVFLTLTAQADFVNGKLSLSGEADSFDYINEAVSTENGLVLTFSFSAWSENYMADGFTLALFDADTAAPDIGSYGGSLGYANRTNADGLAGGVLGIGFDAHGNFSAATEGRNGGSGRTLNSVALRGSMGSTRQDGYEYIAGTDSLSDFMNDNRASTQADALTRDVRVTVTADELVSVEWKPENDTDWTTLIDGADASEQMELPDEIKVGFTSSLNEGMNVEISTTIQAIPEPAVITLVAGFGISLLSARRIFVKA